MGRIFLAGLFSVLLLSGCADKNNTEIANAKMQIEKDIHHISDEEKEVILKSVDVIQPCDKLTVITKVDVTSNSTSYNIYPEFDENLSIKYIIDTYAKKEGYEKIILACKENNNRIKIIESVRLYIPLN